MFATTALALLASWFVTMVTAETLLLKLEPALHFNTTYGCCDELVYFQVVEPQSTNYCWEQYDVYEDDGSNETVCGGNFSVDLSEYDGIEFSFEAPEGKELFLQLNPDSTRIEAEFEADAPTDCDLPSVSILGQNVTFSFVGSDVDELMDHWNQDNSFVFIGCEIFTRLQLDDFESNFTSKVSKLSWAVSYNTSVFVGAGTLDYSYDTKKYMWLRIPFKSALVDATVTTTTTTTPTTTPTDSSTETPTDSSTTAHTDSGTTAPTDSSTTPNPTLTTTPNSTLTTTDSAPIAFSGFRLIVFLASFVVATKST